MSNQVIPDEAVEAAARAAFNSAWRGCAWAGRDGTTEETRERYRREARAALEAAASHILAAAWEAGYGLGYSDHVWSKGHEPRERNPYRPTK